MYKERPDPPSHLNDSVSLRKHKGDKSLHAQGTGGHDSTVQVDGSQAGAWLTKGGETILIIPQLPSRFYMESKSKEDNYLAAVSVSMFLHPWQNYFD